MGTTAIADDNRAPGVSYRNLPELPQIPYFDCQRHHACISIQACAAMWSDAQHGGERYSACKGCPIGAAHAGFREANLSPLRGTPICARCQASAKRHRGGAGRLINRHLCINCYNRQRELLIGKNARGVAPTKLAPLAARQLTFIAQGIVQKLRMEHTSGPAELIIAALRDNEHSVVFGWKSQLSSRKKRALH